jgi:5'-3' exonuclease
MTEPDAAQQRVLLAIDGNSLVHRSFHSQAATGFRSVAGDPMWAVRGLLSQLVAAVERLGPSAVVVGFDDPDSSLRRERWPQYKATRLEKPDTLTGQLLRAAKVLTDLGVAVVVPAGLEADDVLASAAAFAPTIGARTVIMTSDRDSFALIDEHTSVLRIINGGVDASPNLNRERLRIMLGIDASQYRDYAALRGDASDNLPGVKGIGPKTAAKLLVAMGSAYAAFEDLQASGGKVEAAVGAMAARYLAIPSARTAWELNCQVMSMHSDLPLDVNLDGGRGSLPFSVAAVRSVFETLQLPWTMAAALRALAEHEGAEYVRPERIAWTPQRRPDPVEATKTRPSSAAPTAAAPPKSAPSSDSPSDSPAPQPWAPNRPRLPRLQPAAAESDQMSLFD